MIAVASSLITSLSTQTSFIPDPIRSTVTVYENVTLEQDTEHDLELKENVAHDPLTTNRFTPSMIYYSLALELISGVLPTDDYSKINTCNTKL